MSEKPITDYDEFSDERKYDRIYLTSECGEITWSEDKTGPGDELYINAEYLKKVLDMLPTLRNEKIKYSYIYSKGWADGLANTKKYIKRALEETLKKEGNNEN